MTQFGSQDMTAVTKHFLLNINPFSKEKEQSREPSFSLLYTTNTIKQQQTRQEILSLFQDNI